MTATLSPFNFSELNSIIASKYGYRSLEPTDPTPIMINCDLSGPLNVSKGFIMCDCCGSVIRKNYLNNHRESGACTRLVQKRELNYRGPMVRL
jgi:hypothetical protein